MADGLASKKKALAGATLMWAIAWEAIKAERGELDPKGLAEAEELIRAGKATVGIYLERAGEEISLAAALVAPGGRPFDKTLLKIRGPVIESVEQLRGLELQASTLH